MMALWVSLIFQAHIAQKWILTLNSPTWNTTTQHTRVLRAYEIIFIKEIHVHEYLLLLHRTLAKSSGHNPLKGRLSMSYLSSLSINNFNTQDTETYWEL